MANSAATAVANHAFGLLLTELHKKSKKWRSVREDCQNMNKDLRILVGYMYDEMQTDARTNVARARGEEVRELVHDIEDCIERFLHRITSMDNKRRLSRIYHAIETWCIRDRFTKDMVKLNKRLQNAGVEHIRRSADAPATTVPAGAGRQRDPTEDRPVGIAQAKKEFLTLLDEVENEPRKLRVIAIVGFGGSGKTTLANAVYESAQVQEAFPLRAWVDRADYENASELLKFIIRKFWPVERRRPLPDSSNVKNLGSYLKTELANQSQRYLIVIDDVDMNHWNWIQFAFQDQGTSSRIIVTTTRLPTAYRCCASSNQENGDDGYVYHMGSLGDGASQELSRLNQIAHESCACQQGRGQCPSLTLQNKCNGLPLALVSVANHFRGQRQGRPTTEDCAELCNNLGYFLQKNSESELESFTYLRRVLMYNCNSLVAMDSQHTDVVLLSCLLYLGIFPDAQRLKRKKITRRWVAEGYVQSSDPQKNADKNFKNLINLSMIQPIGISTSSTCKALGIVHEFVLHKSISENFIMAFDSTEQSSTASNQHSSASSGDGRLRRIRHLFVRGSNITNSRPTENIDLSYVRSLTVVTVTEPRGDLGSLNAGDGFFKFSSYKVIRVLDLEECTEVRKNDLKSICMLWNLRYLSLGPNVDKLPKEIAELKLLVRLHLSKTTVTELPVDIFRMPCLIHVIGKFMLQEPSTELVEQSKGSNLETVSGIVAHGRQGFLPLLPHMKKLKKVKICFDQSTAGFLDLGKPFVAAIKMYLKLDVSRSLSIDFDSLHETDQVGFLNDVKEELHGALSSDGPYYLSSLKLRDKLLTSTSMPQFIALLSGLTKLCLSLKYLRQNLLSAISELHVVLLHLKLTVDEIPEELVLEEGKFQYLTNLCIEVRGPNSSVPKIGIKGDLPKVQSFQLLYKHLDHLCGIDISKFKELKEIELHIEVSKAARTKWETAARDHPNRPYVLPFLSVDDDQAAASGAATSGHEDAVAAVDGGAHVDNTPSLIAVYSTASEGPPPVGKEPAESLVGSTSPSDDDEPEAAPVTTSSVMALNEHEDFAIAGGAAAGIRPAESLIARATITSHYQPTEIQFAVAAVDGAQIAVYSTTLEGAPLEGNEPPESLVGSTSPSDDDEPAAAPVTTSSAMALNEHEVFAIAGGA